MAIQIDIYKDATVKLNNGDNREYEAIYPTHNGLVTGGLIEVKDTYEKSMRRRFGRAKPVQKQYIEYYIFKDIGFIRDGNYTFFKGKKVKAFKGKLTQAEKWQFFHL